MWNCSLTTYHKENAMPTYTWFQRACVALLVAAPFVVAETPRLDAAFDDAGLASLTLDGRDILRDGALSVQRVVLADAWRNRNQEPDATMYHPDTRTFRDARTTPFEHHFEAGANRLIQLHEWGRLTIDYKPGPDRLDMEIMLENTSDETIEFVDLQLASLSLPGTVNTRLASSIPGFMRTNWNLEGPDIWRADFDGGRLLFLSLRPEEPMQQRITGRGEEAVVSVTAGSADGGQEVLDKLWNVRPIAPGETDRYQLSLRAADPQTSPFEAARDVLERYAEAVPMRMAWPDRRPIGALHIGDARRDNRNPRGWFVLTHDANFPAATDPGYTEAIREHMLNNARQVIDVAQRLGLQGVIVWQLEGMQEPGHAYYGEPRIVPFVAPEIDAVADDYFALLREAGLRIGMTLRPVIQIPFDPEKGSHSGAVAGVVGWDAMRAAAQRADWSVQFRNISWTAAIPEPLKDFYAPDEAWSMLTRLDNKIRYAKERWGATLFYLDANNAYRPRTRGESTGNWAGRPITARLVETLQRRHPDCQIVSEHQNFRYWTTGAQYVQPPHFGQRVTPGEVRIAYPDAMSVVAAVAAESAFLAPDQYPVYRNALTRGDTFLLHAWYGGHLHLARNLFGVAAMLAPYQIVVREAGIEVNGQTHEDAGQLAAWLATQLDAAAPPAQRRAFVRYPQALPAAELQAVLDAVAEAGGLIGWTQPDDDDWTGVWGPDRPLRAQEPDARALVFRDPDNRNPAVRVVIANATDTTRVQSFALDPAKLGIRANTHAEVAVEHLDALWMEPDTTPPPAAPGTSDHADGAPDGVAGDLLAALDHDLARLEQPDREAFAFDVSNVWFGDGVISLEVEANGFRYLRIRLIR